MLLLFLLLLIGCTKKPVQESVQETPTGKFLVITAEPGMNNQTAVVVDIVQAKDSYVWEQLVKLTAAEYFSRKNNIVDKKIKIWSIDVLDTFWVEGFQLQGYDPDGVGVILFANYSHGGPKTRCIMNLSYDCTRLNLGKESILEAQSSNLEVPGAKLIPEKTWKQYR